MRVLIERTWITTASGARVAVEQTDRTTVEAGSLSRALLDFVFSDSAKLLGTITESDGKAVATGWKDGVYLLTASSAPALLSDTHSAGRVLVTEDDEAVRKLLITVLSREGFLVDSAVDGEQAIRKIAAGHYDAILLDLMMPKMSGFEVIAHLERVDPDVVRSCMIVITAASNRDLSQLEGKPIFRVIRKPFDVAELLTAVRACTSPRLP